MDEKLRKKILAESHEWSKEILNDVLLKYKFLPVRTDPFRREDVTDLYVLAIFVTPASEENKFFAVTIKDVVVTYKAYIFNKKGRIKQVKGENIYKMILKSYDKTPLKKF